MFREEITHHKDSLMHHDPENAKTLKIYEYLLFGSHEPLLLVSLLHVNTL